MGERLGATGGNAGGGTNTQGLWPTGGLTSPGTIIVLDAWQGYTLRKLTISTFADISWRGRVQIRRDAPESLHPGNAPPGAYLDLFVSPGAGVLNLDYDFAPGLITVEYGEKMYLVVYDWLTSATNARLGWSVNYYWEPIRGGER